MNQKDHHPVSVNIRRATSADEAAVLSLFQEHLQSMAAVYDPTLDADMEGIPSAYESAGGQFFIAETDNGILAGMGGLLKGVIKRLHVQSAFRRQGLASQLIQRLIQEHQQVNHFPLEAIVDRSNLAARKVFIRCGFRPTGITARHPKSIHCEILVLSNKSSC